MPKKKLVPSSFQTSQFYDELINGEVKRGLWGQKKRFDGIAISKKISVAQYFLPNISRYINRSDTVLELGCGPVGFWLLLHRCASALLVPIYREVLLSNVRGQ